ncbi:glutaredoxin domain-containing protein [Immundisolibacter sp.]|uniref:glutaredoxin domain-containing protein n=1 Tax=Immundisolibacter sp. TaxID=1934948 RepID=UPI0035622120
MKVLIYTLLSLTIPCSVHASDIHKWQDKDGQIHFGDRSPAETETEIITITPDIYQSPAVEGLSPAFGTDDVRQNGAGSQHKVVMYSTSWCGYCKKARRYFAENGIPYVDYDVETSAKGKRDYRKLGAQGVPVILVGNKRLNGFSQDSFNKIYKLR